MADEPLNLDDLERVGATRFGRAVVRVRVETDDGREIRIEVPVAADDATLSAPQQRVMKALADSPEPLTRKQLAGILKRSRTDGRFGEDIRWLKSRGKIFEDDGELTDDVKKFDATT